MNGGTVRTVRLGDWRTGMSVGELRQALEGVPDSARVVRTAVGSVHRVLVIWVEEQQ